MNIKKPTPMVDATAFRTCPVCGKRAYSANGIHPQCAVRQAEAPRKKQLKLGKKLPLTKNAQAEKARSIPWKKKCPKCGIELHVRSKACGCGHRFIH